MHWEKGIFHKKLIKVGDTYKHPFELRHNIGKSSKNMFKV